MTIDRRLIKRAEDALFDYKNLKCEIKNLEIDIENIKLEYKECAGISYEEKIKSENKFTSVVEEEVLQKERQIDLLNKEVYKRRNLLSKIENALSVLGEIEYKVIELRYFIQLRTWEMIGERLELSASYCRRINKATVANLSKRIFIGEILKAK